MTRRWKFWTVAYLYLNRHYYIRKKSRLLFINQSMAYGYGFTYLHFHFPFLPFFQENYIDTRSIFNIYTPFWVGTLATLNMLTKIPPFKGFLYFYTSKIINILLKSLCSTVQIKGVKGIQAQHWWVPPYKQIKRGIRLELVLLLFCSILPASKKANKKKKSHE